MECDESRPDFEALLRSQRLELAENRSPQSVPKTKWSFWAYFWFETTRDIRSINGLSFEEREVCLSEVWTKEVIPEWERMRTSNRARELYYKGIPVGLRGEVWQRAIGNEMNIQPSLFAELARLAEQRRAQHGTNHIHAEKNRLLATTAQAILVDVPRTFPHLSFFHDSNFSQLSQDLSKLLEAFVMLRPDVGYSQGMSFVGAMLLLYMKPHDAFASFVNILNQSRLVHFFQKVEMVEDYMKAFSQLLREHLPHVQKHFESIGIEPQMYLLSWIMSVFCRALPLELSCRVWDLFVMEGDAVLFGVALGILDVLSSRLLSLDFDGCVRLLSHLRNAKGLDQQGIFDSVQVRILTDADIENALKNC